MKSFLSALSFLTVIPVRSNRFDPAGMVVYFPVVGLIIGLGLVACDYAAMRLWSPGIAALIDILYLALITGALHIDGVADTADGLYGFKPASQALKIMKDSRIGAMGMICVLFVVAIKWGGIFSLDIERSLLLLIIPSYARGAAIFGMKFLQYGRPDGGTGHGFFEKRPDFFSFSGLCIPIAISLFTGFFAIAINVIFLLIVVLTIIYYKYKINCITGDMLGAMIEITEAGMFLILSARLFI